MSKCPHCGESTNAPRDTMRVITVRLTKSLHDALKQEARDRDVSLNRLCVAKLRQPLPESSLVPDEDAVTV